MRKGEMKRALFRLAAQAIADYPYTPGEIIGDRVAEARWEEAKAEVAARLDRYAKPRPKKNTGQ